MIKSLKVLQHHLSQAENQVAILEESGEHRHESFKKKAANIGMFPLKSSSVEVFQVNMGKMCNQVCQHCHVDAGPDRKEIMTKEVMKLCLDVLAHEDIKIVDLTGGAPELNPNFRWFVEEIKKLGKH
ncbi:MAG: radical SAM protein, partial [Pedobacter sp.]|nr:radical SAM protein [Pedobacter sp.]